MKYNTSTLLFLEVIYNFLSYFYYFQTIKHILVRAREYVKMSLDILIFFVLNS